MQQAQTVKEGLGSLLPACADTFVERYTELEADLLALDEQLQSMAPGAPGWPLLASLPVYQYLARRYGLNPESVLWEPDSAPDDAHWQELQSMLEGHVAVCMLCEGEPQAASVERLASLGI